MGTYFEAFSFSLLFSLCSCTLEQCYGETMQSLRDRLAALAFDSRGVFLWNSAWTIGFVGSLYLWRDSRRKGTKDNPPVIKRRLLSASVVTIACILCSPLSFQEQGFIWSTKGVISALSLVGILFLGPLVLKVLTFDKEEDIPDFSQLTTFRNIIAAPLLEEFVFRAAMTPCMLKAGYTPTQAIMITPLFFSLGTFSFSTLGNQQYLTTCIAHLHHIPNEGLVRTLFQAFYTTIFGWLGNFLLLRTGTIGAPIVAHVFCNYMGFPPLSFDHKFKIGIWIAYVLGIVGFFGLASPLTDPVWHRSIFYDASRFVGSSNSM